MQDCLDHETLEQLSEGRLPEPVLSLSLIHLEYCSVCQASLDKFISKGLKPFVADFQIEPVSVIPEPIFQVPSQQSQMQPDQPPETPRPIQFGRFQLISLLKDGPTCKVYEALDRRLNRHVAIKILKPEVMQLSASFGKQFLDEARIAAQIQHVNVVPIFDVDVVDHQPLIVMPMLAGETLKARLAHGPIRPELALRWTLNIIDGLQAAHQVGVIHRDIKPGNIWVRRGPDGSEDLLILDFGISQIGDSAKLGVSGSPSYMAPEQAMNQQMDQRSDIFSLGCVLFEMLTGQPAWPSTVSDTLSNPLDHQLLKYPVKPVLKKLFALNPVGRYQNLDDLRQDILKLISDLQKKRMITKAFAVISLLLAGATIDVLFFKPRIVLTPGSSTTADQIATGPVKTTQKNMRLISKIQSQASGPLSTSDNGSLLIQDATSQNLRWYPPGLNESESVLIDHSEMLQLAKLSPDSKRITGFRLNDNGQGVLLSWQISGSPKGYEIKRLDDFHLDRPDVIDLAWLQSAGVMHLAVLFESEAFGLLKVMESKTALEMISTNTIPGSKPGRWYANRRKPLNVIAMKPGGMVIYNHQTHSIEFAFRDFIKGPVKVSWSPDGQRFVAGSPSSGEVNLYDLSNIDIRKPAAENALNPIGSWDLKQPINDLIFLDSNFVMVAVEGEETHFLLLDITSDRTGARFGLEQSSMQKWAPLPDSKHAILDDKGTVLIMQVK